MKLLGTHVYPKNKYLTLQMTKSVKGVACEDVFESMVSFSAPNYWMLMPNCVVGVAQLHC